MATVILKNVMAGPIKSGLDLTFPDRHFVVLAGPAGSGTSTIVRLIAGLDEVSQGEIFFDDRSITDLAPKDRDVAFLAHDYRPYPGLSVFENLAIGLRRRNFAGNEIQKRIAAVASALGLEAQLQANAEMLSAEQRRQVGLARAMVRQPKVYLFDEPFAGLESDTATRGRAEIAKLYQRSPVTIIYATTLPTEALALGERTLIVRDGQIQQDAPARTIYDAPMTLGVAKFFGDPPMNLVTGIIKEERSAMIFVEAGDGTISVPLAIDGDPVVKDFLGRSVILGFRPEDVELDPQKIAQNGFRVLVDRAEARGAGIDVYLKTGAHGLVARSFDAANQAESGQRLAAAVAVEKTHLFDAETGRRITQGR